MVWVTIPPNRYLGSCEKLSWNLNEDSSLPCQTPRSLECKFLRAEISLYSVLPTNIALACLPATAQQ